MVELVAQYLTFNRQVSIQGVGTFSVEELPARLDFPNRLLHAPEYLLHFDARSGTDLLFEQWLQKQLSVSSETTKEQLQKLSTEFQRILSEKKEFNWPGLGLFSTNGQQLILFTSHFTGIKRMPVTAEKVIRKNAQHSLRVGEQEKTNVEMEELLQGKTGKKLSLWWFFALLLLLTSIVGILYIMNYRSPQWQRQGNSNKTETRQMPALYKIQ